MNENSVIAINNMPSANVMWRSLGGNFSSLEEVLCEFVDNSISNFVGNPKEISQSSVLIRIIERSDESYTIQVEDSGTGIKNLDAAFTLGSHEGADSTRNEWGFGIKHAFASVDPDNKGWSIYTRTKSDFDNNQFKKISAPYSFKDLSAIIVSDSQWPGLFNCPGTLAEFPCTKENFKTITLGLPGNYTLLSSRIKVLKEDLGYIYSDVIASGEVNIKIHSVNLEGETQSYSVEAIMPDFEKCDSGKTIVDLGNGNVEIEYQFGILSELNQQQKYKRCYKCSMDSSGLELRINGRLLEEHLLKEIWNVEKHPSYNFFLAKVNLISNDSEALPPTKTTKSGLRSDDYRLLALYEWIRNYYPKLPKNKKLTEETVHETFLFEQLRESYENAFKHQPGNSASTEIYAYEGIEQSIRIDLFLSLNGKAVIFEGKKDKTTPLDVYQLRMYWDGCVFDKRAPEKAILIASYHPESVARIANEVNKHKDANGNNYNIVLELWSDEGITVPGVRL